jgi:hypothetical protein
LIAGAIRLIALAIKFGGTTEGFTPEGILVRTVDGLRVGFGLDALSIAVHDPENGAIRDTDGARSDGDLSRSGN